MQILALGGMTQKKLSISGKQLLLLSTLFTSILGAQSGPRHDLTWNTIDGGGGRSTSPSGLTLHGTTGQFDTQRLESETLSLLGGFWPGGQSNVLLKDSFENN